MSEALHGQIEHITFTNEETGYTVARLRVEGSDATVTVVGNLLATTPGEVLRMTGEWVNHPRFGRQFKVESAQTAVPVTGEGMKRYLGSGLIPGIGPEMAERIVHRFGDDTAAVLEREPHRLEEVPGIGAKRRETIAHAWEGQRAIRDVMVFLQEHGIGTAFAVRIFKRYGHRSIAVVRENPYRLASDIPGVGFVTADRIARKMGFAKETPARIQAGILYVLHRLAEDGHVFYPHPDLLERCHSILEVGPERVAEAVDAVRRKERIVVESLPAEAGAPDASAPAVYLSGYHRAEVGVARRICELLLSPAGFRIRNPEAAVEWIRKRLPFELASLQVQAVRHALTSKMLIVTGGPGTGKTTIVNAVLRIFRHHGASVLLTAPTGRAAKRLTETTGREAKTIHRLLEFSFQKGGFQRNEERRLSCDLVVVDEASMIDILLMGQLLRALPDRATLMLVGDASQLPSVGAGNVLADLIDSRKIPVVELEVIFRQARASRIVVNAHRIHDGRMPLQPREGEASDYYFIEKEDPEQVLSLILRLVSERIPSKYRLNPIGDIQVLTPMHRGVCGAARLNQELQRVLNPRGAEIFRGDRVFRTNDKVMQLRNNYDREVFNGDVGRIRHIDPAAQKVAVAFDRGTVTYDPAELDELALAYAVSVHKSQGSEYPAVVIPLLTQHYILLQRNLLYTAITRGKQLVVLVGSRKAVRIAVHNDRPNERFTGLRQRLVKQAP
ncbi:MAG: ATP-dependent RecD-like DNA helicase [Desulfobacteraceae bacterium]|nr:ATP-dependent RecD-like DNA helicase [Desulfobacteraceae bacterium]